jgi:SAM-dependent methyltransferase
MLKTTQASCLICETDDHHETFAVREMYFGTREMFDYFECSNCGAIQIVAIPDDMSKHYPSNYYSYSTAKRRKSNPLEVALRRKRTQAWLGHPGVLGSLFASASRRRPEYLGWLTDIGISINSSILDVGSGSGQLLLKMQRDGFLRLRGIDPFNATPIDHGNGLCIDNKHLQEEQGAYDLIMFHHSLEHMAAPQQALIDASRLLNENGRILIRIPVAGGYAWRKYREHWYALDAPRHLFVPNPCSMQILATRCGLKIERIFFDSDSSQFAASEAYMRDIPASQIAQECGRYGAASPENQSTTIEFAKFLNAIGDGDTAGFVLHVSAERPSSGH